MLRRHSARRPLFASFSVVTLIATALLLGSGLASADPCIPGDPSNPCIVDDDPITPPAPDPDPGDDDDASGPSGPTDCTQQYVVMDPQPPAYYSWWQGLSPTEYTMYWSVCPKDATGADGMWYNYLPVLNGQDPPLPPPDPVVIAREAMAQIHYPEVRPQFGPDSSEVAVNIPVWLYVDNPGTLTDSRTVRGLTVTISAAVSHLSFDLGEPGRGPIECDGLGSAPTAGDGLGNPPCGFTYTLRSLPERTGGAGEWPVNLTATWTVTWTSSTGRTGTLTTDRVFSTALYVGEYRTVILPR